MINVADYMVRCADIYEFYIMAIIGLNHGETLKAKIERDKVLLLSLLDGMPDTLFVDKKPPPIEYWSSEAFTKSLIERNKKVADYGTEALQKQTVVLYHSFIELIMGEVVEMILKKHPEILKSIYMSKEDGKNPLTAAEIIDKKDAVVQLLIEKEVDHFTYKSMKQKEAYFKKHFDIAFKWGTVDYGVDIHQIDELRHKIIHTDDTVIVDDAMLVKIKTYLNGFGMQLLFQSRLKYQTDVVWTINGINYIR